MSEQPLWLDSPTLEEFNASQSDAEQPLWLNSPTLEEFTFEEPLWLDSPTVEEFSKQGPASIREPAYAQAREANVQVHKAALAQFDELNQMEEDQAEPGQSVQQQSMTESIIRAGSVAVDEEAGVEAPEIPEELEPLSNSVKAWRSFKQGNLQLVDLAGGAALWAGYEGGAVWREWADEGIKANYVAELGKEFEMADLIPFSDASFYSTKAVQMIPSILSLIPAMAGGAMVGSAVAGGIGLGAVGMTITTAVASAMASRPLESAMEAMGTYNSLLDQGISEEEASQQAADVFTKNLSLMGMDAAQFALAFGKVSPALRPALAKFINSTGAKVAGFATGALAEGYEEVLQGFFQEQGERAARGEVAPEFMDAILLSSPEAKEQFALGTLGGLAFQSAGKVKDAISTKDVSGIIQEQLDRKTADLNAEGIKTKAQLAADEGVETKGTVQFLDEDGNPIAGPAEAPIEGEQVTTPEAVEGQPVVPVEQPPAEVAEPAPKVEPKKKVPEKVAKEPKKPVSEARSQAVRKRHAEKVIVSSKDLPELPALDAIRGVSLEGDFPQTLAGVRIGRGGRNAVGSSDVLDRKSKEQNYDTIIASELPQAFQDTYGNLDSGDGRVDIQKLIELAEKEVSDYLFEGPDIAKARATGAVIEAPEPGTAEPPGETQAPSPKPAPEPLSASEVTEPTEGEPPPFEDPTAFDVAPDLFTGKQEPVKSEAEREEQGKQSEINQLFEREQRFITEELAKGNITETQATARKKKNSGNRTRKLERLGQESLFESTKPPEQTTLFDVSEASAVEPDPALREEFAEGEASPFEQNIPKDIKIRKDIGVDLFEATRKIGAQARHKILRGKMLGVFRGGQSKIELGDIRWVRTLAHELGHAVDFVLNDNAFPRTILKRFPDAGVKEKELRSELKRASEYIRPLSGERWDVRTTHIKYRAKHSELMADLVGLYLLDPAKARSLAPNITSILKDAISANEGVKEVVDSVLKPEQAQIEEVSQEEQQTTLPPKPEISISEPDPALRAEAFELVKQVSRSKGKQLARVKKVSKETRTALPESQRELLSFFIEKTGDPRIQGDTFADVQRRMTPAARKLARTARFEMEFVRQETNKIAAASGLGNEWVNYLADYIPHFYVMGKRKAQQFASRWSTRNPHTKQRKFPTLKEAVDEGLTPISYDWAYLYERSAEINFTAALTTKFANNLKDMRTSAGEPVMVNKSADAGPDWVKIEHPALKRIYAKPPKDGRPLILAEGNAWVHPEIARPVKVLLDSRWGGGMRAIGAINSFGKALNVAFSLFHEIALINSSQAANMKFLNPLRGIFIGPFESKKLGLGFRPHFTNQVGFMLEDKHPLGVGEAIKSGLEQGRAASTDQARGVVETKLRELEAVTSEVPFMGSITKSIRQGWEMYQTHLWDNVHVGLKLFGYHDLASEILQDIPVGVSIKEAKEAVASAMNDAFGGQEFLNLPRIKGGKVTFEPATIKMQQIAHAAVFAPDWTVSNIRIAGRALFSKNPVVRKIGLRYWRNMIPNLAGQAILVQYALFLKYGDDDPDMQPWPWENEPGREWDIDVTGIKRDLQKKFGAEVQTHRTYIHTGKQVREVIRYFDDYPIGLMTSIGNKSSNIVRWAVEQLTGHQAGSGFPMPWSERGYKEGLTGFNNILARAKATAETFIPFAFHENNFAFAVPKRKGMSRYRAQRHHKDAIESFVDPTWWDKIKTKATSADKEKAAIRAIQDVDAALAANGFTAKDRSRAYGNALSKLRSEAYGRFWNAIDRQDWDKADQWAVALLGLGVTAKGVVASGKTRGKTVEQRIPVTERFIAAGERSLSPVLNYKKAMRFEVDE